jgi:hypothetical protein
MLRASIAIACFAACVSQAAPPVATSTPPPAVEPPRHAVKPSRQVSVAHTMWRITTSDDEKHEFYFMDDGQLHYNSQSGFWKDGFWTQQGPDVHIHMNDHYAEYNGTIVDGAMTGTASNKVGHDWTWTAEKADGFPYPEP